MKRPKQSAGLLMFRRTGQELEFFLVHPGGPFWVHRDAGVWTIPKGEYEPGELPLDAAQREFQEETGFPANAPFLALGFVRQKSGKVVHAWAFEGDCDPASLISNQCEIEWPPRSAKRILIPEIDRGAWFALTGATVALRPEQQPFLSRLMNLLSAGTAEK